MRLDLVKRVIKCYLSSIFGVKVIESIFSIIILNSKNTENTSSEIIILFLIPFSIVTFKFSL